MGDFLIPQESIDLHEQIAEDFITSLGKNCKLYYPPVQIKCINCTGGNQYANGPYPFTNGGICPYCQGQDFTLEEVTEDVRLMVYINPKEWVNYGGFNVGIADNIIQTRGLMSNWIKIERCNYMVIHNDVEGLALFKYEKIGVSCPFGARLRTEFLQFWKRAA